jgi:hypothetical protein
MPTNQSIDNKRDELNEIEARLMSGEDCDDDQISRIGQFLALQFDTNQAEDVKHLKEQFERVKQERIDLPIKALFPAIRDLGNRLQSRITVSDYNQLDREKTQLIAQANKLLAERSRISEKTRQDYKTLQTKIEDAFTRKNEVMTRNITDKIEKIQTCIAALRQARSLEQVSAVLEVSDVLKQYPFKANNAIPQQPNPSQNNDALLVQLHTHQQEVHSIIDTAFNEAQQRIETDIRLFISAVNALAETSHHYIDTPQIGVDTASYQSEKNRCGNEINAMISFIEHCQSLPITKLNTHFQTFLETSKEQLHPLLTKLQTIEQKTNRQNELNDSDFNTRIDQIRTDSTLNDSRYEQLKNARNTHCDALLQLSANYVAGSNHETINSLNQKLQTFKAHIDIEHARITSLASRLSDTQPSFVEALTQLQEKSIDLMHRDNGAEDSVEWQAHEQLEALIQRLRAAEYAYITNSQDDAQAIQTFKTSCNTFISQLNDTIINQPRGWSITRVLDNITSALDALIDYVCGHAPNTTKTIHGFFHYSTTTEKQIKTLEKTIEDLDEPPRGLGH